LPFHISNLKLLPKEELEEKKEGTYLTIEPEMSSDPLEGFGVGAEAQLFFNGKKADPFFEYTPYKAELAFTAFYTTKNEREFGLSYQMPYIFHTKWRFFGEMKYEVAPNKMYFGLDEKTLSPLTNGSQTFSRLEDYENSLTGNKSNYNTYQKEEKLINMIGQYSFLDGTIRAMFGFELGFVNTSTPLNDSSLLAIQDSKKSILGFGNSFLNIFQAGLVYDTRDLETDPSNGTYAQIYNELSLTSLGSQFNFNKTAFQYKYFKKLFPGVFKKCVLAARFGINDIQGSAPFYEYMDQEAGDESISLLGGSRTLRGYVENRFIGNVMSFGNVEMRFRFLQHDLFKQHFAWSVVPFADAGGAWNSLDRIGNIQNIRFAEGLGFRIAWDVNTILRFDYAFSPEGNQFFFQLGHAF